MAFLTTLDGFWAHLSTIVRQQATIVHLHGAPGAQEPQLGQNLWVLGHGWEVIHFDINGCEMDAKRGWKSVGHIGFGWCRFMMVYDGLVDAAICRLMSLCVGFEAQAQGSRTCSSISRKHLRTSAAKALHKAQMVPEVGRQFLQSKHKIHEIGHVKTENSEAAKDWQCTKQWPT